MTNRYSFVNLVAAEIELSHKDAVFTLKDFHWLAEREDKPHSALGSVMSQLVGKGVIEKLAGKMPNVRGGGMFATYRFLKSAPAEPAKNYQQLVWERARLAEIASVRMDIITSAW